MKIKYVPECPPNCGWFDCGLCREVGYAEMDGFKVIRTSPKTDHDKPQTIKHGCKACQEHAQELLED